MKLKTTILAVAAAACTAWAVVPESGDMIVIDDLNFVVLSTADWARLTNMLERVERRYAAENATESGRRAWHGEKVSSEIISNGFCRVTVYADGYRHYASAAPRAAAVRCAPSAPMPRPDPRLPPRLAEKRLAISVQTPVETNMLFRAGEDAR